jgi:glycosyltransferase involved in cell wall biosynthesis
MKKVLLITYYWPPAGGSGVQRPLKFAKYLREFGWEPVILTVADGEFPEIDNTLLKEVPNDIVVIKRPIREPYSIFKLFTGKKKEEKVNPNFFSQKKKGFLSNVAVFIRSNFFIPDARMWWIKPTSKFLVEYLKENKIDAIISTGPPHSLHVIAKNVKAKTNIPWLADFRDPWTEIDYFKELILLPFAKKKHEQMEKEVLKAADKVVCVTPSWSQSLEKIGGRKVDIVFNGFDPADFSNDPVTLDKKFTVVHTGMFSKGRNHEVLWKAMAELVKENKEFADQIEIHFYGSVDGSVNEYAQQYGILDKVTIHKYVPHTEIVKIIRQSQVLYSSINDTPNSKGILTGKLFEYMATKRPILCIGPLDGDSGHVIKESQCGLISSFDDVENLKKNILTFFEAFLQNIEISNNSKIEIYSRKYLTGKLANLLNEIA